MFLFAPALLSLHNDPLIYKYVNYMDFKMKIEPLRFRSIPVSFIAFSIASKT